MCNSDGGWIYRCGCARPNWRHEDVGFNDHFEIRCKICRWPLVTSHAKRCCESFPYYFLSSVGPRSKSWWEDFGCERYFTGGELRDHEHSNQDSQTWQGAYHAHRAYPYKSQASLIKVEWDKQISSLLSKVREINEIMIFYFIQSN
jgi:hypothetical protein